MNPTLFDAPRPKSPGVGGRGGATPQSKSDAYYIDFADFPRVTCQ